MKWTGYKKFDIDGSFIIIGAIVLVCVAIYHTPKGRAIAPHQPTMTAVEFRMAMLDIEEERNALLNDIACSIDGMPEIVWERLDNNLSDWVWKGSE